jgi:hypothetical protein
LQLLLELANCPATQTACEERDPKNGRWSPKFPVPKQHRLFTNAKIPEDYVEQVFDLDGAGNAAEAAKS